MSNLITSNQPCPKCSSSDAYQIYEDNAHCFSCSYHVNFNKRSFASEQQKQWDGSLPEKECEICRDMHWCLWFRGVGVKPNYARRAQIYVSSPDKDLVIPMHRPNGKIAGYELRLRNKGTHKSYTRGNKYPIFLSAPDNPILVICEDIRSALKLSKYYNTLCLMGTTFAKKHMMDFFPLFQKMEKVFIWLDGDKAGQTAAKKIHDKLKLISNSSILTTEMDPKYYSYMEMAEKLGVANADSKFYCNNTCILKPTDL